MIMEFSMYYLSFLPLWMSVIFIDVVSCIRNEHNVRTEKISIFLIVIGIVICSLIAWNWITDKGKQNKEIYTINNSKEVKFATAEFLMSYVVPLFAFDFTKWDGVFLFFLFFWMFWFLVHRHMYFCTNIVLEFVGYRVYESDLVSGGKIIKKYVVSKNELNELNNINIRTKKFNNDYQFEIELIK